MFGRSRRVEVGRRDVVTARGGVSGGGIITGVVVAFGAGFILSAIVAGILAAVGVNDTNVTKGDLVRGGLAAGIALVIVQFVAYLWGGYTAGRMARGAGVLNGLLVPLMALVIGLIVGAVVYALGSQVNVQNVNLPFSLASVTRKGNVQQWGLVLSIAALAAMFVGGALGGGLGARWHTKLETAAADYEGARTDGRASAIRDEETRTAEPQATDARDTRVGAEPDRPPARE